MESENFSIQNSLRTQSHDEEMLDIPTNKEDTNTILDMANNKCDAMPNDQKIDSETNKMEVDDILDVIEEKHLNESSEKRAIDAEEKCESAVTTMVQTILDSIQNEFPDQTDETCKETFKVETKISDENFSEDGMVLNTCSGKDIFELSADQTLSELPEKTESKTILDACDVTKKVAVSFNGSSEGELAETVNDTQKIDGQTVLDHASTDNCSYSDCQLEVKCSEETKNSAFCSDSLKSETQNGTETESSNSQEPMTCTAQIDGSDSVIENGSTTGENDEKSISGETTTKQDVYDIDNDGDEQFTHNPLNRKLKAQKETLSREKSDVTNEKNFDGEDNQKSSVKTSHFTNSSSEIPKPVKQEPGQMSRRTVVYVYSKELVDVCDQMPKIPERASMVHSLIEAYGLTRYVRIVEPRKATDSEVTTFHDLEYIEFLKKMDDQDDTEKFENDATQYGLTYDCPLQQGIYNYGMMTTGATLVAAECLLQESCQVAINWCGGWHHAAKDQASGFCYINDIVIGILKLKEKYSRVLYVDLDLHHGDGVEDAFSATSKVMTVSFHKFAPGFFPGTGRLDDIGIGKGQYYSVNIPLLDGVKDTEFTPLVCRILNKVKETFRPEAVVCQCGADGLAGDPMESFNLTHKGLGKCLYFLLQWNIPTLILGGGGYNLTNTARCWTYLTGLVAGKQLPVEIPDHQYFMEYGPDYDLEIQPGNRKNHNTAHYLRQVYGTVMNNVSKVS